MGLVVRLVCRSTRIVKGPDFSEPLKLADCLCRGSLAFIEKAFRVIGCIRFNGAYFIAVCIISNCCRFLNAGICAVALSCFGVGCVLARGKALYFTLGTGGN